MGGLKAQKGEKEEIVHTTSRGEGVVGGVLANVFLSSHLALIPRYPHGTAEADSKGSALSLVSH